MMVSPEEPEPRVHSSLGSATPDPWADQADGEAAGKRDHSKQTQGRQQS